MWPYKGERRDEPAVNPGDRKLHQAEENSSLMPALQRFQRASQQEPAGIEAEASLRLERPELVQVNRKIGFRRPGDRRA